MQTIPGQANCELKQGDVIVTPRVDVTPSDWQHVAETDMVGSVRRV